MSALPPVDTEAAERMWADYAAAYPDAVAGTADHTVERFGDSPRLADELLALVLQGRKRATAERVAEFVAAGEEPPRVGSHWVVCDGAGAPRAVLRSLELRIATFGEVDAAFAHAEGEDDRTLESWRREHRRYWTRVGEAGGRPFDEERDEIVLERFAVVWPPEVADRPHARSIGYAD